MRFIINGGKPLRGTVTASGSKNAALPIICATLLSEDQYRIKNVPDIADVRTLLSIMKFLGSEFTFEDNVLTIQTKTLKTREIPLHLVNSMRASILLIGPLLARVKKISIGYPGGCVLGKRPIDTHLDAFRALGVSIQEQGEIIYLDARDAKPGNVVLKEISVTATENLLMFASGLSGEMELRLAAQEPHVVDLSKFLIESGVFLQGEGSHTIMIRGGQKLIGIEHRVTSDYLEIGTLAIAAAGTFGDITIRDVNIHDLDALWQKLEEAGVTVEFSENAVRVQGSKTVKPIAKLDTGIFPKFASDLQAPFMVLMTQANGVSKVFETLFEGRLNYLFELEKMGARFEFLNPHQAIVIGETPLKAAPIASCDIRAGAAMIIAALMAKGTTEISQINYIDRGYERLDEKLRSLGANIVRCQTEEDVREQRTVRSGHGITKQILISKS